MLENRKNDNLTNKNCFLPKLYLQIATHPPLGSNSTDNDILVDHCGSSLEVYYEFLTKIIFLICKLLFLSNTREKIKSLKFGDLGGNSILPCLLVHLLGKNLLKKSRTGNV